VTDEKLERIISAVLKWGVLCALALALMGAAIHLVQRHSEIARYSVFHLEAPDTRTVHGIWFSALRFDGRAIMQLGVMVLILTPIMRVAVAAAAFAFESDYLYVIVSLTVLAILAYSITHSL
jgi:uncharacterized membrane protein